MTGRAYLRASSGVAEQAPEPAPQATDAPERDRAVTLYSPNEWYTVPTGVSIERLRSVIRWPLFLADLEMAVRLWLRSRQVASVGFIEVGRGTLLFCLLRSILPTRGKVIVYRVYLQPSGRLKMALLRRAIGAASFCVVWSNGEGDRYSAALGLPRQHFVTVRYKCNHSRFGRLKRLPLGDFVFSGGNSVRDYRTLFEAVRGLDIPVVVSRTDESLTRGCEIPENVLIVKTGERDFARLMASARLVVIPLTAGRFRSAGEASLLDAMWHGRPVICADDVSAAEYIEDGVDGVVVPPGDPAALRQAISAIWNDRARAEAMGQAGLRKVKGAYTTDHFVARMLAVAGVTAVPHPASTRTWTA